MYKTLEKVTKDPYNHTFLPVYVYFEVKFDLSKKSQMVQGVILQDPETRMTILGW